MQLLTGFNRNYTRERFKILVWRGLVRGPRSLALIILTYLSFSSAAYAWHKFPPSELGWREQEGKAIRGITVGPIECPNQTPCGYGTEHSAQMLDEVVRKGGNWIALTPFGRLWSLASTTIRLDFESSFAENKRDILAMIRQAHDRGLKVILIPHVFIELSGLQGDAAGSWRGDFNMTSRARWAKYHASYHTFVTTWARVAQEGGAEAFSIGAECTSWSGRFGNVWSALIADTRKIFSGYLTYSANWYDDVYNVIFWDQLDFIGINAFFDLAQKENASLQEYRASAWKYTHELRDFANLIRMPIVFMELGYTSRPNGGVRPWKWPENVGIVQVDEEEQSRSYEAITEAFLTQPWFAGFFVWRYPAHLTDLQEPRWGYSPHEKKADQTLKTIFHHPWSADPTPWYNTPNINKATEIPAQ